MNGIVNKIIKDIKDPILYLNNSNLKRLTNLKYIINYILNNNIINKKIIENILDDLLDLTYCYGEELNELYFSFLNYYEKIDKEASHDYKKFYLEILKEN